MNTEEKLQLNRDRQKAVRDAWSREKDLVSRGLGTVDWTPDQQKELLTTGHVSGYEGQHMKSVQAYPEYAASADNIQFLTHEDHLAAHNSAGPNGKEGYRNVTNGYYNPKTGEMKSFGAGPPIRAEAKQLTERYQAPEQSVNRQTEFVKETEKQTAKQAGKSKVVEAAREIGRG
ncbi:MAG: hypothetical protein IKR61_04545 [Lachnospiraceae bacterium]|nr:hypothetical protein [Lachnospiraceae bacterium]